MDTLLWAGAFVTGASLLVWVWLVVARGRFWTTGQRLDPEPDPASADARDYPAMAVIVPARNEADTLPATLPALLRQEYPGPFTVFLVDDSSADGTAAVARAISDDMLTNGPLTVVSAGPLPEGWAGKVWAMHRAWRPAPAPKPRSSCSPTPTSSIRRTASGVWCKRPWMTAWTWRP